MSKDRRLARTVIAQELLQHRLEFRYPNRGHIPDFVEIHALCNRVIKTSRMPQIAFKSSDARWLRASAETRLAASPITSTFRITASCNCSDCMNTSLPGPMKRV